jgi:muramoyltetrapeptide carboxypeptidase
MRPPFIQTGDSVALIGTARWLTAQQCDAAQMAMREQGLQLVIGKNMCAQHFQLAGTVEQRLEDIHWAFSDPSIKGIVIGRGGYGTVQLLDALDMGLILANPKWVVGYSDATALICHLNSFGLSAIHGSMPVQWPLLTPAAFASLFDALRGDLIVMEWMGTASPKWPFGQTFPVWGGNLSVIVSLLGSISLRPQEPVLLCIEDIDEMLYHVDRMLHALGRSYVAGYIAGILVGGFTDMRDNTKRHRFDVDNPWGCEAEVLISQWSIKFGIPILTGLPIGHHADNRAFYMGEKAYTTCIGNNKYALHWQT